MVDCYKCGIYAETEEGIIYVRAKVNDKWGEEAICLECWKETRK